MKFEHTTVMNFENALRGMRNPKESWHLSDSKYGICGIFNLPENSIVIYRSGDFVQYVSIGEKDMNLAQRLIRAGNEHRKFMRQIFVSVDITAPLYWWKEFDTYKVGTVANSTSTMHKLTSKPITIDCFEFDDFNDFEVISTDTKEQSTYKEASIFPTIDSLESLRKKYIDTKDKKYWKELVRWLPESWLQTRTVTFNYENLLAICSKSQRRFHKLNEWSGINNPDLTNFISWARTLPYANEFIFIDEGENKT